MGIKLLLGLFCRAESCPHPRRGEGTPPYILPEKGAVGEGFDPSRDVYGIRGRRDAPLTTGYANPSKTTFSSAQMFSCEAL